MLHGVTQYSDEQKGNTTSRSTKWVVTIVTIVILSFLCFIIFPRTRKIQVTNKTVAILPFVNSNHTPEDDYFINAITEDVLNQLSKIGKVEVISFATMMQYKDTKMSVSQIADELNAGALLRGSIVKSGVHLHVDAQLINPRDEKILWTKTYACSMDGVLELESEIPLNIADALGVNVTAGERESIEKKTTSSSTAYDSYVKGREYYYSYTKNDNENAIRMFKNALEQDPRYSLAYAGLGDSYCQRFSEHGFSMEWLDSSIAMSKKAITFDSSLAEGYKALGAAYYARGWYKKALDENAKAVGLNPGYSDAVNNFGVLLVMMGDFEEGVKWVKKATLLDPTQARSYVTCGEVFMDLTLDSIARQYFDRAFSLEKKNLLAHTDLVWLNLSEGNSNQALIESRKALSIDPDDPSALEVAGLSHFFLNNLDSAMYYFDKFPVIPSHSEGAVIRFSIMLNHGEREQAMQFCGLARSRWLDEIQEGNELSIIRYDLAAMCAVMNENEDAYKWLQEAINLGWLDYRWPQVDPLFVNLRKQPRFKEMMQRISTVLNTQKENVMKEKIDQEDEKDKE